MIEFVHLSFLHVYNITQSVIYQATDEPIFFVSVVGKYFASNPYSLLNSQNWCFDEVLLPPNHIFYGIWWIFLDYSH